MDLLRKMSRARTRTDDRPQDPPGTTCTHAEQLCIVVLKNVGMQNNAFHVHISLSFHVVNVYLLNRILSALLDGEISILVAFATKIVKQHP